MHRRTLLRRGAAVATLALAGCTSSPGPGSDDDTETGDGPGQTETPTDGGTGGGDGEGDVTTGESTFDVTGIVSGTQVDRADVSFESHSETVSVDGTIWGADGCKTAELDSVVYDEATGEVTISVATIDREGTEDRACTQAIVQISYEAVVAFEGGLPASTTVVHDGRAVAEARRE